MKRLLTIFLSSIAGIGLWGQQQTVPMTVIGDVYNEGDMVSLGTVHLKALDANKVGKVENYGKLTLDTIIFYTNSSYDGLLRNNHVSTAKVNANTVIVRKNFGTNEMWYTISLPFDVNITSGIINPLDGNANLKRGTSDAQIEVQWYDAKKRADTGKHGDQNWITVPGTNTAYVLAKGKPHRVGVDFKQLDPSKVIVNASYDVDFATSNATDIKNLFESDDKGLNLAYYGVPGHFIPGPGHPVGEYNSDGWNIIGGLNSDIFKISGSTLEYRRAIYYWDGGADWEEFYPDAAGINVGTLRPYGSLFIKIEEDTPTTFTKSNTRTPGYGGFAYFHEGNILIPTSPLIFRSMQNTNVDYDLFELKITDAKNSLKPGQTYFKFNNNFSSLYEKSEDDITWSTAVNKVSPKIWSLAKIDGTDTDNTLFVNSLPYENHEIPLGVNIPAAGEYIFSLSQFITKDFVKGEEIESIVLWDKTTGIKMELLKSDYHLQANSNFNTEDRFVLLFNNKNVTSIDQMPDLFDVYAYAESNVLTVKNLLQGDRVLVMDLTGRTVVSGIASGNTYTAPLNQKGIYIVNVRGGKTLKILNK